MSSLESQPSSSSAVEVGSFQSLLRNYISIAGLVLAFIALANIVVLFCVDVASTQPSPYTGILAYMILPGVLILGLAITGVGMIIERRRRRKLVPGIPRLPRLDLNNPTQRGSVAFFLSFVVVFVLLSLVGSYRAYEYTDSKEFCGQLCHTVMHPEATAHQNSPHARVSCVECHVGSGASWYVKSKMSGLRQVYKTAFNKYPHPIETPVMNLRPASQTCEQCHWPRQFWGAQLKVLNHFAADETNTPRQIRMLIKTGGGDPSSGQPSGIHWHMNIANKIEYRSDPKRQTIPYVRVTDGSGKVSEYFASGSDQAAVSAMPQRRMDCVDCHNRPTHIYMPPDTSVDQAMAAHRISTALPFAKQQSVEVLTAEYKSTDEAMKAIAAKVPEFYRQKYPQIASQRSGEVQAMVSELQSIFKRSIFPEMKVDWRTHPNNVGHLYSAGCFRCHDGNHATKDGKVITKDCNSCHTMLGQDEGKLQAASLPQQFKHPVDLGDLTAVNCADCHNGGVGP